MWLVKHDNWYLVSTNDDSAIQEINKEMTKVSDDLQELFKKYYSIAKECGSKSITVDLKNNTIKISVD